jgi:hypothetical protein
MAQAGNLDGFGRNSPLAGLGYGLPVARQYARYFGGDLQIMSVEGYGTDAFVHLNRFGNADPLSTGGGGIWPAKGGAHSR